MVNQGQRSTVGRRLGAADVAPHLLGGGDTGVVESCDHKQQVQERAHLSWLHGTVKPARAELIKRRASTYWHPCLQVSGLLGILCCLAVGIPKQHLGAAAVP